MENEIEAGDSSKLETSSHREQRLFLHSLGIYGSEEGEWKIGTYLGSGTICVNYTLHGKSYHRSDYGGILPRWLRIGLAIRSITKEANSSEPLSYDTAGSDSDCRWRLIAVVIRSLFVGLGTVEINMQMLRK